MVYNKSKIQIKNIIETLKSLGKIVAISDHQFQTNAIYYDGTLKIIKGWGIITVGKYNIPEYLERDPWLKFQVDIVNNVLIMSDVTHFCHQISDFIWQANDMTCHNKFEIYFPFSNEWEVELEII